MSRAGKLLPLEPGSVLEPGAAREPGSTRDDRRRRWLSAALAALLVALYLISWLTYTRLHLPPERYEQRPPGSVASKLGADFTLVALTQSVVLTGRFDQSTTAPAQAVWVVARMDVTRRTAAGSFNCQVVLVAANGRSWEPSPPLSISRELKNCPPTEAPLGRTTPIEAIFMVPEADASRILGVAVPQNGTRRDPVLTPPR